jgi:NADH-quinone oxidoreductase subunit G
VVLGRPSLGDSAATIVDAAAVLAGGIDGVAFLPVLRRANVHGAIDMGLSPGLLPGRVHRSDAALHYEAAWGRVPGSDGMDAAGILEAAADGRVDVLVLLGADPISDFPDRRLAERAVAGARTVIAVDTFLNESSRRADVVLPAAGFAEVDGTTTNLEGRVTVLNQKVTAVGSAHPDWQIAAELALALGSELGMWSVTEIQAEIAALAPSHLGVTPEMLGDPGLVDGIVPLFSSWVDRASAKPDGPRTIGNSPLAMLTRTAQSVVEAEVPVPAQPAEMPEGAEIVDADGEAEETDASDEDAAGAAERAEELSESTEPDAGASAVPLVSCVAPPPTTPPAVDSYAFRLIAQRSLYDQGTLVQHCEHLAPLAPGAGVRLNPSDLSTLGVAAPASVAVKAGDRSATLPTVADPMVAKGTAVVLLHQAGGAVDALLRHGDVATDVRIEVER